MRYLIDGYNLMHAQGLMRARFGPNGLRRTRHRFLNDLAQSLGQIDAATTTVVFDAREAPEGLTREGRHHGLSVIYAVEDEDADSRIEQILAQHPTPKKLVVVSSDLRLRKAALRRKARSLTADQFLDELKAARRRRESTTGVKSSVEPTGEDRAALAGPSASVDREMLDAFGDLDAELSDPRHPGSGRAVGLTDEEIRRMEREIEAEIRRDRLH